MRRVFALVLTLALLLCGCGDRAKNMYLLYCPVEQLETAAGEGAIKTQRVVIDGASEMDSETLSTQLLTALLEEDIAPDTTLLKVEKEGRRMEVDFSREYASLTGIDLTLADYCVTLTLTQIDGISAVSITSGGRTMPNRDFKLLTAADPLLGVAEDTIRPVTVQLYFWDSGNESLVPEPRTLELYEGQSRADALLAELIAGPQSDGLERSVPEELDILSVRVEEHVCYLNLSSSSYISTTAIEAIVRSLNALSNVQSVQLALDGESIELPPELQALERR